MSERVRDWAPDVGAGAAVLLLTLLTTPVYDVHVLGLVLVCVLAAGLARRAPAVALGLVWLAGAVQLVVVTSPLPFALCTVFVGYSCARWGSTTTVTVSGLSIPASVLVAGAALLFGGYDAFRGYEFRPLAGSGVAYLLPGPVLALGLVVLVLGTPWLTGLTVRSWQRARSSQVTAQVAEADAAQAASEREQAQEIAALRESQARLAGDVHDVVGHSLAVILAQAESGQYLPDDDPARLKATLATIATSARTSLHDVREVLASTRGGTRPAPRTGALDELVEGVRRSGHVVESTEFGTPQPLPPELAEVAHRVLQEMLTNAIRHGDRDAPVVVERHWEGELRMEVVNAVADPDVDEHTRPIRTVEVAPTARPGSTGSTDSTAGGQGLVGMRRRLESVGGRLDVRRRDSSFTATAWLPVRR